MNKILVILIVLFSVGILIFGARKINNSFVNTEVTRVYISTEQTSIENFSGKTNYIDITSTGLSTQRIEIVKGDKIIWRNKDTSVHWIASNLHPNHLGYPEIGGCIGSKFDSCGAIIPGEEWSFVFEKVGTWGYHDDYNPVNSGTIVVRKI